MNASIFIVKNKRITIDIATYFKIVVLKELCKNISKTKPIKIPTKIIRKNPDNYRAYQREYCRKYYHTHIKPLRESKK